jgi:hypothetical protein
MPVVGQVGMSGGPREYEEAAKVLDDARRKLYAILAGDKVGHSEPAAAASPDGPGTNEEPAS